jgi:hypothetical protein
METGSIAAVATAVLAIASAFLGAKYRKWIGKARLFAGLLDDIFSAAEDDKVSEEELKQIIAKAKQLAAKEGDAAVD